VLNLTKEKKTGKGQEKEHCNFCVELFPAKRKKKKENTRVTAMDSDDDRRRHHKRQRQKGVCLHCTWHCPQPAASTAGHASAPSQRPRRAWQSATRANACHGSPPSTRIIQAQAANTTAANDFIRMLWHELQKMIATIQTQAATNIRHQPTARA
jgi:hypothetical protein